MSRYFFHTECARRITDVEGSEHDSLDAARSAAGKALAVLLTDEGDSFWGSRPWTTTVADNTGLTLFTVYVDGQNAPATRTAHDN